MWTMLALVLDRTTHASSIGAAFLTSRSTVAGGRFVRSRLTLRRKVSRCRRRRGLARAVTAPVETSSS